MRISIIAAVAENRVIGRDGTLPWHLPEDLKRFKRLTMGHTVVMGRKTWESLPTPTAAAPTGPLPGRRIIVLTTRRDWHPPGAETARTLDEAISLAATHGETELFIIGGARLFAESLPRADRLYLTQVHAEPPGDTFFPPFDPAPWTRIESTGHPADARHAHAFTFLAYDRPRRKP
jgi:dihydrofolate reductase